MRADDIVFEYRFSEWRFTNKIRKTCETEENKNNSHIAGWLKSVNVDNTILVRIQCEAVYFFCSVHHFSIEFCQNFFGLQSEVPSRDLNGDGDNWPRWIRICHFYFAGTHPSKPIHGDISPIASIQLEKESSLSHFFHYLNLFRTFTCADKYININK